MIQYHAIINPLMHGATSSVIDSLPTTMYEVRRFVNEHPSTIHIVYFLAREDGEIRSQVVSSIYFVNGEILEQDNRYLLAATQQKMYNEALGRIARCESSEITGTPLLYIVKIENTIIAAPAEAALL